jgi:predicted acylesterase/phospholipase RssA
MSQAARSALVLQGGGALGAYELGAARRLYHDRAFAPDLIAGVSIGAITAVLLARPAKGLTPLAALEEFWRQVTVSGWFLPPPFQRYASLLGNPNFFTPRLDFLSMASWTNYYDLAPLRRTLEQLVDLEALADPKANPKLLMTATNLAAGEIECFNSGKGGLSLDHVIASSSLPPSFAMTTIGENTYWDGGLFDNTPLGAVLASLKNLGGGHDDVRTVYVVNLFPNRAPIPKTMAEVLERMQNLQFANKTGEDVELLKRFNEVAQLMKALDALPEASAVRENPGFKAIKARGYVNVPTIIPITRPQQVGNLGASDFSPEAIAQRAAEGYAQAEAALKEAGLA